MLGGGMSICRDMERAWPEVLKETQEGVGHGSQGKRLFPVGGVRNGVRTWREVKQAEDRTTSIRHVGIEISSDLVKEIIWGQSAYASMPSLCISMSAQYFTSLATNNFQWDAVMFCRFENQLKVTLCWFYSKALSQNLVPFCPYSWGHHK